LENSIESTFYDLGIKESRFNRNGFYNLTFIVRAFLTASLETLPPLIEDVQSVNGSYYTTFRLAGFPIAQCRTYREYRIRQLINVELGKNAKNMKWIEDEMNKIQSSLDGFKEEINKITNDVDKSGRVRGECIHRRRFFHSRRYFWRNYNKMPTLKEDALDLEMRRQTKGLAVVSLG
jgi:hypothetical protein